MYILRWYYSILPGIFESVSHVLQSHYTPPAGKQSTRNRNSFARIFLSASSSLRAGSGKSTHVFGMISSQSVRVGNLNPPSFQQMALSLVCYLLSMNHLLFNSCAILPVIWGHSEKAETRKTDITESWIQRAECRKASKGWNDIKAAFEKAKTSRIKYNQ